MYIILCFFSLKKLFAHLISHQPKILTFYVFISCFVFSNWPPFSNQILHSLPQLKRKNINKHYVNFYWLSRSFPFLVIPSDTHTFKSAFAGPVSPCFARIPVCANNFRPIRIVFFSFLFFFNFAKIWNQPTNVRVDITDEFELQVHFACYKTDAHPEYFPNCQVVKVESSAANFLLFSGIYLLRNIVYFSLYNVFISVVLFSLLPFIFSFMFIFYLDIPILSFWSVYVYFRFVFNPFFSCLSYHSFRNIFLNTFLFYADIIAGINLKWNVKETSNFPISVFKIRFRNICIYWSIYTWWESWNDVCW